MTSFLRKFLSTKRSMYVYADVQCVYPAVQAAAIYVGGLDLEDSAPSSENFGDAAEQRL